MKINTIVETVKAAREGGIMQTLENLDNRVKNFFPDAEIHDVKDYEYDSDKKSHFIARVLVYSYRKTTPLGRFFKSLFKFLKS